MDQAGVLEGHRSGAITGPLDKSLWITPFPFVPGHDWQNDKPRWADTPKAGDFPERNDIKVLKGGRIIARLIDYDVFQRGFEISSTYSCANRFPEVYHIARSKVLT